MVTEFAKIEEALLVPDGFRGRWRGSALTTESTLHQLSPYIGKIKSSMAATLVSQFTEPGDYVFDPFSGSGTVALEAWIAGRRVVANDLNPYAALLTQAKLCPCSSPEAALRDIAALSRSVEGLIDKVDLRTTPAWVRGFFHPKTLREILAWTEALREENHKFLHACLLGILHHQRPGFLSFPSSHTVPYLRLRKFPRHRFPSLYAYRPLRERLEAKVQRALRRVPTLDFDLSRACCTEDARSFIPVQPVSAIITSPPYMRQLDYGRDNRLRLWFLGAADWKALDGAVSPAEEPFLTLMKRCLALWKRILRRNGRCVLVIGDAHSRLYGTSLPDAISQIAVAEVGGYRVEWKCSESIPNERRVRRGCSGSLSETILVLRRSA